MRWLRLFLLTFLIMGAGFGLFQGLLEHSVRVGVVRGVTFGALVALIDVVVTARRTRGRAGNITPRQDLEVMIAVPLAVAVRRVVTAMYALSAKKITVSETRVTARTAASRWSWGERLAVDLVSSGGMKTAVKISSRPRVRTTVVDYGHGRQVVDSLARSLTDEA
jgi:hypothetical protein